MSQSKSLERVRDQRIARVAPLATPRRLLGELPLTPQHEEVVIAGREHVSAVLDGVDDRLLVVVGPCSVHDSKAATEYARRLAAKAEDVGDDLLLAMRVYFEKPRTTTGWKGMINDPHLDDSGDVNTGLLRARKLLLEVLSLGLPVGCEFLDPITPQYISDTVAWGAIGARTTESQIHRQLGSGLSMPIGFKNRTDGNVQVAVDAVRAAAAQHAFAGVDDDGTPAILHTRGNPDGHVILRGGRGAQNHGPDGVEQALEKLRAAGLPERLVVDASHDNSGKDAERQPEVAGEIGRQLADGQRAIVGVMLESFLVAGRQDLVPGRSSPTASRSPTPAWPGTPRSRSWTAWRPRCARGAKPPFDEDRGPGRRVDRRLDRPGRAPERGRGRGGRPRPLARAAGAGAGRRRHRRGRRIACRGPGRRRRLLLLRARGRADRPGARRPGGRAGGLRGHRRGLGQAHAGRDRRGRALRGRPPGGRRRDIGRGARPARPVPGGRLVPDAQRDLLRACSTSACTS